LQRRDSLVGSAFAGKIIITHRGAGFRSWARHTRSPSQKAGGEAGHGIVVSLHTAAISGPYCESPANAIE
jgi:hypothetical protein